MSGASLWCILIPKRCWKVVTTKSKKKEKYVSFVQLFLSNDMVYAY